MQAPWSNTAPVNVNLTNTNQQHNSSASLQNILGQHDGASDAPVELQTATDETKRVDDIVLQKYQEILKQKKERKQKKKEIIAQFDGNSDDESDDDSVGGDDELDSDLDDEDDTEPETENFVLCQYEKVTRIKNKRKTNLKDGIMHLNGRDSVFHKATGEFDW